MISFAPWLKGKTANLLLVKSDIVTFFFFFFLFEQGIFVSLFYWCWYKHFFAISYFIITTIHRSDRELLGPNNQFLPKIVSVFAEVILLSTLIIITSLPKQLDIARSLHLIWLDSLIMYFAIFHTYWQIASIPWTNLSNPATMTCISLLELITLRFYRLVYKIQVLCAGKDLATEQTASRMVNLLRQLQQTLPPNVLASTWSSLQPQQQLALQSVLST